MMIMGGRCREGGMARLTLETNKENKKKRDLALDDEYDTRYDDDYPPSLTGREGYLL